jgi:hypothetical protein
VTFFAKTRSLLIFAAASWLISPFSVDGFCAQEPRPRQQRVWKVKESSTRLWIRDGMLVSANQELLLETIPLSSIKALAYETSSDHPATGEISAWIQDLWDAAPEAGEAAGFIIFPMAAGAVIPSLFLPLKETRHLICLDWERDGKNEKRVYLLSKSDALSLLDELRRATGLQCSDSSAIRCSRWLALEKSEMEREHSLGHVEHGRLVIVDRGHGISSLEMGPIPHTSSVQCTSGSRDLMLEEARDTLKEPVREQEGQQRRQSPDSTKPRLRILASRLSLKVLLSEMTCRELASEPSAEGR